MDSFSSGRNHRDYHQRGQGVKAVPHAVTYVDSWDHGEFDLGEHQLRRVNELLLFATQYNGFYREKLHDVVLPLRDLEAFRRIPFTRKTELVQDQVDHPPYGTNHSYPGAKYVRYHQTSGTTGRPLKVLDTQQSWEWWLDCWLEVLRAAGVTSGDRVFLAFSFGPFIGFWAAYEGAEKLGALVIAGGGQSSLERLNSILTNEATVLMCTPSYALHLAEVAKNNGLDIAGSHVTRLVHAGEPGASIPSVRHAIESAWGATCYDHSGMTEMGAYGYSCTQQCGLHVNEREFLAEIIHPQTLEPVAPGETGELVLTNFGRYGFPLIRYRTSDIVRCTDEPCACGSPYRLLPDGIIGRADDMVVVRGVNVYPQSVEAIVREFPEVVEFRIVYETEQEMAQVRLQVEAPDAIVRPLATKLRARLGLRIDVEVVPPQTLPRFEMKARRILDLRSTTQKHAGK